MAFGVHFWSPGMPLERLGRHLGVILGVLGCCGSPFWGSGGAPGRLRRAIAFKDPWCHLASRHFERFWAPFGVHSGSLLPSFLVYFSVQISARFWVRFGRLLGSIWAPFWPPFCHILVPKSRLFFGVRFRSRLGHIWGAKRCQKEQKRSKNRQKQLKTAEMNEKISEKTAYKGRGSE